MTVDFGTAAARLPKEVERLYLAFGPQNEESVINLNLTGGLRLWLKYWGVLIGILDIDSQIGRNLSGRSSVQTREAA